MLRRPSSWRYGVRPKNQNASMLANMLGCCTAPQKGSEVHGRSDDEHGIVLEPPEVGGTGYALADDCLRDAGEQPLPWVDIRGAGNATIVPRYSSPSPGPPSSVSTCADDNDTVWSDSQDMPLPSTPGRNPVDLTAFVRHHTSPEGEPLSNDYEMSKEIARGGYAQVWLVRPRRAPREKEAAAKKVALRGDGLATFTRERSILLKLDHPYICKLLEVYQGHQTGYLVMEYCEGGTLLDGLPLRGGKLEEDQAAQVVGQVAHALGYIHGLGVAHRDLKLENICMWSWEPPHAKLVDFGLACNFETETMLGHVGSLDYAAPEVLRSSSSYTSACDLWSLGVVAYVLLSGKVPFWGSTSARLGAMRRGEYPRSGNVWDNVSRPAHDFVRALLKWEPEARMRVDATSSHPFLRGPGHQAAAADAATRVAVLTNVRKFAQASLATCACAIAAARHLDQSEFQDACKVFTTLDASRDGCLEYAEVAQAFAETLVGDEAVGPGEMDTIFSRLQPDSAGRVCYTMFCAASLGDGASFSDRARWAAFQALGANSDGTLSQETFSQTLAASSLADAWPNDLPLSAWSTEQASNVSQADFATSKPEYKRSNSFATNQSTGLLDFCEFEQALLNDFEQVSAVQEEENPGKHVPAKLGGRRVAGKTTRALRGLRVGVSRAVMFAVAKQRKAPPPLLN